MKLIYQYLTEAIKADYKVEKELKKSVRGTVELLTYKQNKQKYILRRFKGNSAVYQKLLHISCSYLPLIYEEAVQGEEVLVLEEFIEGDSLAFFLEGTLFSPAEAKKITIQLCKALWTLHQMQAVHRDVKPENVIIRGNEAILIDFDAARVYKQESKEDTQILGTTGFAAPEQYGISQSDERADIYSVGVLLNIMLTGKHPSKELAQGKMGRIVQKCTMTNPKKRYKNILHLMEVL